MKMRMMGAYECLLKVQRQPSQNASRSGLLTRSGGDDSTVLQIYGKKEYMWTLILEYGMAWGSDVRREINSDFAYMNFVEHCKKCYFPSLLSTSRKHLRANVTPSLHLKYSKNGGVDKYNICCWKRIICLCLFCFLLHKINILYRNVMNKIDKCKKEWLRYGTVLWTRRCLCNNFCDAASECIEI